MDERWSRWIQTPEMMDATRSGRFTPRLLSRMADFAGDFAGERYLEIGCGPGALVRKLADKYPDKRFEALDMDTGFLAYAQARTAGEGQRNIAFVRGDAYALPFEKDIFDGTLSFTVLEHVEPSKFLGEQYRVLKPGGQCLVMSMFPSASLTGGDDIALRQAEEAALVQEQDRVLRQCDRSQAVGVAKYALAAHEIPKTLVRAGFAQVEMDFLAVNTSLQPNDGMNGMHLRAEEISEISNIAQADALEEDWAREHPGYARVWTREKQRRLQALIEERYAVRRVHLADTWAVNARMMMMVRGIKPDG